MTPMRRIETALLIDDAAAFRTTLQLALRRRGVQARTAATVDEGMFALDDAPVDLIVLDNRMPFGDGMSALGRFRARCPESVILMLTGYGDIPLAVQAVRSGADALLTKPIDADALLAEVEAVRAQPRRSNHLPPVITSLNLEAIEREAIGAAMRQTGGVVAQAAKVLGIDRRTLQRKLRRSV